MKILVILLLGCTQLFANCRGDDCENPTDRQPSIDYLLGEISELRSDISEQAKLDAEMRSDIDVIMEELASLRVGFTSLASSSLTGDCHDVGELGVSINGLYSTRLGNSPNPTTILCEFTDGYSFTIVQQRVRGDTLFNQSYQSYKTGFGRVSTSSDFWLGLEAIHQMTTTRRHFVRIEITDWDDVTRYAVYDDFIVGDEQSGYQLRVGDYRGNAGDALRYHNNTRFSTYDHDQDTWSPVNCADVYGGGGGWWYRDCLSANLNGEYLSPPDHKSYTGIVWWPWRLTPNYSYKSSVMKICHGGVLALQ